jgi:hypothetical protein
VKANQAKKSWSSVFLDESQFKQFLKLVRQEGIKSISMGDVSIEFQEKSFVFPGELKSDSLPQLSDEERKKQEDDLLFHSAG